MKKSLVYFVLSVIFLTVSSCKNELKDGDYHITIVATNDLHGRFFDSLYVTGLESSEHKYSLSNVSHYLKNLREAKGEQNVVLLDLGDHLQGDNAVFYYNFIDTTEEHIFSRVANYMKYDAVVVGNHDIEAGKSVYNKIVRDMRAPYLAANAINITNGKPYFKPYTILQKNGIRIAVIGMTNPNIPKWLSPVLWEGIRFEEIVPLLDSITQEVIRVERPHLVIAVLHAGLGEVDEYNPENPARYIAANIPGIDIVFASHDHKTVAEVVSNRGKDVWVMEAGSRASNISKVNVKLEISKGETKSIKIDGLLIPMEGTPKDIDYLSNFRLEFLKIKEFTNRRVGELQNTIKSRDAYFGPSEYLDMIHSLQLDASGADISFAAPLSFNVTIKEGELNYQSLMDIYPYENQLYVIEMTGKEVKDYLEFSYSKWVNTVKSAGDNMLQINKGAKDERARFRNIYFNFDSAAGILYSVDITKDSGERVKIISMAGGGIFDNEKRYKIALSSYRASGGGDLLTNGAGISRDSLESRVVERMSDIRELLYQKITNEGKIKAAKLNHWKFIPEGLAAEASRKDRKILFQE